MSNELNCIRCGHIWMSQSGKPIMCSRCHNRLWNTPRRNMVPKNKSRYWGKNATIYNSPAVAEQSNNILQPEVITESKKPKVKWEEV